MALPFYEHFNSQFSTAEMVSSSPFVGDIREEQAAK
jgi:hypothetical protein